MLLTDWKIIRKFTLLLNAAAESVQALIGKPELPEALRPQPNDTKKFLIGA